MSEEMTRKEAIKQLRLLKGDITFGIASKVENKNQIEALSIAIASLETDEAYQLEYESTTKNNLGVEKIVDVLGSYTDLDIPYKREIAENILTKLSSVTPQEPKIGHWIFVHPLQADDGGAYMCSSCKVGDWGLKGTENFCPNCGCAMVEPPQESEGI